jgi:glycosyltransferase involved in cell wall biosynthesis
MKLLLVSHHFPPMGGAGVQRALKFVRYLSDFGITPVVLAGDDPGYLQDPSLLAELPPSVRVLRVPHRTALQRLLALRPCAAAATAPAAAAASSNHTARDALLGAWATLQWPDERGGWARAAWAPARQLLKDEGIEMVMSTAPPVSAHALARRLARDAGLPWVADWRDLWADNPGNPAPAWRRALERRTEAHWLRDAAGVIAVTPAWQRLYAGRLGDRCPVAWIPNGYDEADFAGPPTAPVPADDALRLVHVGSFYGPRDPAPLLDGFHRVLEARPPGGRSLRLRLVGAIGRRFESALAAFENRHPGTVERRPYVPHAEALGEMRAADALLLVVGAGDGRQASVVAGTLPGKLFEYLRADRPVLLLGDPSGDAAALLREHGAGWIADETQPEAIALALAALVDGAPPAVPPSARVARFERRALAGELADFLRSCRARWQVGHG